MSYLKPLFTIVVFICVINQTQADSCDCLWQGSFAKITTKADLIVSGEIVKIKGNALDLQIDRIFKDAALNGKEFNEQIRIWANNGNQCRPDIDNFTPNSRWLMALYKIVDDVPDGFNPNTPNISFGRINDYYLSKCGAYWLQVHDGFVSGNLVNGRRWQWENKKMNPVLLELIDAYIKGYLPKQALVEAAKPSTEAEKLMNETKTFLNNQ